MDIGTSFLKIGSNISTLFVDLFNTTDAEALGKEKWQYEHDIKEFFEAIKDHDSSKCRAMLYELPDHGGEIEPRQLVILENTTVDLPAMEIYRLYRIARAGESANRLLEIERFKDDAS